MDSGLTAKEFAAEAGLNPHTLSYWKWRLRAKRPTEAQRRSAASAALGAPALSFVEVARAATVVEPFEVELGSGVRVRVPASFDADALGRLLGVLGRA
jgi:transcriptional regulator with XRE-family HTH domain